MACNNCMNGCVNPQNCACDCTTCAEANGCDIPVGDTGPQGPQGPQGLPGVNGTDGVNGADGTDGCTLMDVYISDGTDGNVQGDVIVTTGPTPTPCNQAINAGNIIQSIVNQGALIPSGIIVMWAGALGSIPAGWSLCDGTNSTPNLSGKFIASYGAGDPNFGAVLAPGGSTTVSLIKSNIPVHVHGIGSYSAISTIPVADGLHRHTIVTNSGGNGGSQGNSCYRTTGNDQPTGNNQIMRTGNSLPWPSSGTDEGAHTHAISTTLFGASEDGTADGLNAPQGIPFNILPLFVTLAYIRKD